MPTFFFAIGIQLLICNIPRLLMSFSDIQLLESILPERSVAYLSLYSCSNVVLVGCSHLEVYHRIYDWLATISSSGLLGLQRKYPGWLSTKVYIYIVVRNMADQ